MAAGDVKSRPRVLLPGFENGSVVLQRPPAREAPVRRNFAVKSPFLQVRFVLELMLCHWEIVLELRNASVNYS